jgi:predicted kinase
MAWYLERRERCRSLLWDVALGALRCGTDVFLELGLLQRVERETYYERARDEELVLVVYVVNAPRAVRRERVVNRNRAPGEFTQVVPPEFFERASDAWEAPGESERSAWGLTDV